MSDSEDQDQNNGQMEVDAESNSDSADSGDEDSQLENRAKELEKLISESPYSYDYYVELVGIHKKLMNLTQMRTTYEKFREVFPLTPKLWLDWIKDEISVATSEDEVKYVLNLFEHAVKDYLSVDLWLEYVQYAIGHTDVETTRSIFEKAVMNAGLHVAKGSLVWDAYREFELAHLSCIEDATTEQWEVQAKRVNDVFKRQISVTLLEMERTFIEWKVWVERLPKNDFINKEAVEWGYKNASKYMDDYIDYENKLDSDQEDKITSYRDYIKYERKPEIIRCLYERALTDCSLDPELWMDYCMYYFNLKNYEQCLDTVERALRNCPWNAKLWVFQMQAFEITNKTHDEITVIFEKSLTTIYIISDVLLLWLTYIEHFRRITNPADEKSVEKLRAVFQKGFEQLGIDGDPECTLLRLWAKIEANFLKSMQEARKIWNDYGILKAHGSVANFWLELVELEKHYGDDKHIQKTYQRALTYVKDWPQCIVQSWISYERERGTVESMLNCMSYCSKYIKKYEKEALEATENTANKEDDNDLQNRKRRHSNERPYHKTKHGKVIKDKPTKPAVDKQKPKTEEEKMEVATEAQSDSPQKVEKQFEKIEISSEKEHRSIFVSNLDYTTTEDELKEFLGTFEEVRLVKNPQGISKGYAYVILPTVEDAQKLLSRDREKLTGRPVFISKCKMDKANRSHFFNYSTETEKHKLFVRGLPMTMNEEEVSDLFKPYGSLKQVRLVTYKNGRSKGLAYVEYENASDASNAILGLDNREVRGFRIAVAISDPPKRKFRTDNTDVPKQEPSTHSKKRIQVPLVPRSVQVPTQSKPATPALSNDDFRKMLLNKK